MSRLASEIWAFVAVVSQGPSVKCKRVQLGQRESPLQAVSDLRPFKLTMAKKVIYDSSSDLRPSLHYPPLLDQNSSTWQPARIYDGLLEAVFV